MQVRRIAILSPGEMGHSVGRCLLDGGFDVATCLTGRSERTRTLTEAAGIRDVPDLDALVQETDLILAILVPDQALALAGQVAEVMKRTGSSPAYADCNAISRIRRGRSTGSSPTRAAASSTPASLAARQARVKKRAFTLPAPTRPYLRNWMATASSSARWAAKWAGHPASRCATRR